MDEQKAPPTPPGWYPDPKMAGTQRYWDGTRWSEHVAPHNGPAPRSPEQVNPTLEAIGWIGAVFLTPVGFIIAIIMIAKGQSTGRAAVMLAVAVGMTLLGYSVLVNNSSTY